MERNKQPGVLLRRYDWWTVEEFAEAFDISKDEAQGRIDDLLSLSLITVHSSGYRFEQVRREMHVTVTKETWLGVFLNWYERWKWNRVVLKDQEMRTKAAARYQEKLRGVPFVGGRFGGRY
jgi:hypothetical protein